MSARKTAVVIGAGPGLGMSVARRLGRAGHDIALVSRTGARHDGYIAELAGTGAAAASFPADVRDRDRLAAALDAITDRYGRVDAVYYGPAATGPESWPTPILEAGADSVRAGMELLYPAVDVVQKVLPGMLERGSGTLLFATGLSAVTPLPVLGNLAVLSAALHNYALTLHAALADRNVYAGSLVIGGAVERGDIHRMLASQPETYGDISGMTLNPDDIADAAWTMAAERDRATATFSALA
ncbi:SDR family oxidoreductase [Actinomadura sp. WMMB 499]|uniref:SDR family NAD(P)-dependent oxidoreductase n=1 Tax=Actinomadura sp. WMMB 499 TaxID=1219491 RepID=UPI00124533E8|nr:SDR family NAD(P)-dependent oxidoreductase [Actinomadura sp. WMMB 499]QFG23401.1 SDR family NAD(P)-dependent oxidoreductase [Actinomadura sp. WMMB 499]